MAALGEGSLTVDIQIGQGFEFFAFNIGPLNGSYAYRAGVIGENNAVNAQIGLGRSFPRMRESRPACCDGASCKWVPAFSGTNGESCARSITERQP